MNYTYSSTTIMNLTEIFYAAEFFKNQYIFLFLPLIYMFYGNDEWMNVTVTSAYMYR